MTHAAGVPRVGSDPPLRAVVFDAGLTLIRSVTPVAGVAAEVLGRAGLPFDPATLATAMARADAYLEATWHHGDWWASEHTVRELFITAYRIGLVTLPGVGDASGRADRVAADIYAAYHDIRHWAAFPDVVPTLEALRGAGVTMGVISDWGHGLESILLELELGEYFTFLVVSSRLGISKPHPEVFRMALDRIHVPPASAVYIGDTYVKDVLGARAAGLTPVLLDRAGRVGHADCATVRALTEVLELVGIRAAPAAPAADAAATDVASGPSV